MTVVLDGKTEVLTDILIGDVYIAGGQSNMHVQVREIVDVLPRDCENVRFFKEGNDADEYHYGRDFYKKTYWEKATAEASVNFSAVAFEFAMQLYAKDGVPIGYENHPHHNLYNSSGYLASPFKYVIK